MSCKNCPKGCDTFVALYPTSPKGVVVFGKNSDRPTGEGQSIRRYPATNHEPGALLKCTYITIPQSPQTCGVILSQIDWMWGAEHGLNDCGVAIGNEAVWTKANEEPLSTKRLLGMDLVRLGLERGRNARQALNVITSLLEEFGQGGPCAEDDASFCYHNSFMIVDSTEGWILETASRQWVAKRVTHGGHNISNTLTLRQDYDLHSRNLFDYATKHDLVQQSSMPLDWSLVFGEGCVQECESPYSRQRCGKALLEQHSGKESLTAQKMISDILRSHSAGICMHGSGFETTASMVVEWSNNSTRIWMLDKPWPCQHEYLEQQIEVTLPNP